jgi:hypothetical protein
MLNVCGHAVEEQRDQMGSQDPSGAAGRIFNKRQAAGLSVAGDGILRGHGAVVDRLIRERLSSHPTAPLQPSARSSFSSSSSSSTPATSLFISLILLSGGFQPVAHIRQQIWRNAITATSYIIRKGTVYGEWVCHRHHHHHHSELHGQPWTFRFSSFYSDLT